MLKALAALTASSLLLAAPAAAQIERYSNNALLAGGIHPGIVQGFDALEVPVFDGSSAEICQATETTVPKAFYNFRLNAVLVCSQNINSGDEFISAVTHEAVHMVQDCRSGLHTATLDERGSEYLAQLYSRLTPYLQDNITSVYAESDWAVEIEAFFFQSRPAAVAEGIANFCF